MLVKGKRGRLSGRSLESLVFGLEPDNTGPSLWGDCTEGREEGIRSVRVETNFCVACCVDEPNIRRGNFLVS